MYAKITHFHVTNEAMIEFFRQKDDVLPVWPPEWYGTLDDALEVCEDRGIETIDIIEEY